MADGVIPVEIAKEQPSFVKTKLVDSLVHRALAYLGAGFPVHLTGPAGTGKTCLALFVAAQIGRPVVIMHGDEQLGTSDLVGGQYGTRHRKIVDNFVHSVHKLDHRIEPVWVDNRLTVACKYGFTLVYDEFTRSRAEANNTLLSVLEEGILDMPSGRGQESFIRVHPAFRAIFTSNPAEYAGVHRAADALQDRMITIKLGTYDRETEIAITAGKSGLDKASSARVVDIVRGVREFWTTATGDGDTFPSVRASIMIATVLRTYGAKPKLNEKEFVGLCLDVLDSTRCGSKVSDGVRAEVGTLIERFAA